jgi:hypothetical protein
LDEETKKVETFSIEDEPKPNPEAKPKDSKDSKETMETKETKETEKTAEKKSSLPIQFEYKRHPTSNQKGFFLFFLTL